MRQTLFEVFKTKLKCRTLLLNKRKSPSLGGVTKEVEKVANMAKVEVPLGDVAASRLARDLQYAKTKGDARKWDQQVGDVQIQNCEVVLNDKLVKQPNTGITQLLFHATHPIIHNQNHPSGHEKARSRSSRLW
jgi:hypothetical protein